MSDNDTRITIRLLDPELEASLAQYCAHKRRKKPDVLRNALVNFLEQEGFLLEPAAVDGQSEIKEEGA